MTEMRTWQDIERAAETDLALRQAVRAVESGRATREEALIVVVLWHCEDRHAEREAEIRRLQTELPPILIDAKGQRWVPEPIARLQRAKAAQGEPTNGN